MIENNSPFVVPRHIKAKNETELEQLMVAVQLRLSMKVHFFDIQFVKGNWYAWYEIDLESKMTGAADGNTEG